MPLKTFEEIREVRDWENQVKSKGYDVSHKRDFLKILRANKVVILDRLKHY